MTKENLFLEEINYLCEHNWLYSEVYRLPVPFRKWFIKKIQKGTVNPNNMPLKEHEKKMIIRDAQLANNSPPSGMFQPMRNRK